MIAPNFESRRERQLDPKRRSFANLSLNNDRTSNHAASGSSIRNVVPLPTSV
jgi:hypothetical protein